LPSATSSPNWRTEDTNGGVQSLIDNGKSSQADEQSIPQDSGVSNEVEDARGFYTSSNPKPLFNSLAGFALEIGDRLLINDEEVIFRGWVDQSQTAIEVKAIAAAMVKQIRAKEIKSLARSQDVSSNPKNSSREDSRNFYDTDDLRASQKRSTSEYTDETNRDRGEQKFAQNSVDYESPTEVTTPTETEEVPEAKEPEYNAWEVWTYLERQRLKTLKLLNTFQAEWEANRFVREAERNAPPNLRVHYEIRPILLDEAEIRNAYQNTENSYNPNDKQSDRSADRPDRPEDRSDKSYADAIDVEIIA
jgi:hypothetical protein